MLAKYLGPRPEITFRRSGSIKVDSQYLKSETKWDQVGLFRCGNFCRLLMEGASIPLPNGHTHTLQHHITCQTRGVLYVDKTIRPFWKRIKDHVYYATNGIVNTTMGNHVAFKHKYDSGVFKFTAFNRIYENPRGGNFNKRVVQRGTQWVYDSRSTVYPGLNDMLSFKPFL